MKRAALLALALPMVIVPVLLLALGLGLAVTTPADAICSAEPAAGGLIDSVRIGTLNWRGASHYSRNPHPGERPALERLPNMIEAIDAAGTSVVGFQEFEPVQAQGFLEATDGNWKLVPGRVRGHPDTRNAIAYQPSAWTVLETRYVTISYGGNPVDIPLVKLGAITPAAGSPSAMAASESTTEPSHEPSTEPSHDPADRPSHDPVDRPTHEPADISTAGATAPASLWVLNTHNPADAVGGSSAMQDAAVRAQAAALNRAATEDPKVPLLFVGDMNDRGRFKEQFTAAAQAGWSAANPSDEQIDWILGSPSVTFTDTVVDTSTNDGARRYTDHPFIHTTAHPAVGGAVGQLDATSKLRPRVEPSRTAAPTVQTPCPSQPIVDSNLLTARLSARVQTMLATPDGLCALSWTHHAPCTYDNQCPKVIDALFGGPGTGRGYGNGQDVAQGIIDAGLARSYGTGLDPLPPVGAVVSYYSGDGVGHVALYVGNGKIFGNDYGCIAKGVYGCVGYADVHVPAGSATWALPRSSFDLGGSPRTGSIEG